ncbi:MAG: chemotaxis protein CheW [Desulfobulbaceae bacterium]|nr:chemotaxis protein CheW [Desulfobulbaceae bacterium]
MSGVIEDEILQMYIQESKEHLEDIETDLLEIEQQGENVDEDLINKVFRAAHSIKGGAGFLDLTNIKELAHKIENILDLVRNGQMIPNQDIVNTVLEAFDYLGELLNNAVDSNAKDISEHIEKLTGLTVSSLPEAEKESVSNLVDVSHKKVPVSFSLTEFDLKNGRQGGKLIYIFEFDLIKDMERQGKTPFDLLKLLEDGGNILDLIVSMEAVGDLDDEEISPRLPMYVLYSTIIEPDLVGSVFGLSDTCIYLIPADHESMESSEDHAEEETSEVIEEASPSLPAKMPPPPEKAAPKPSPRPDKKKTIKSVVSQTDTLRVSVGVLDQLMNRAGELVLARNQLIQSISTGDKQIIAAAGQRIDLVTSELQETIMQTRMQPVGNIFNKFPRIVRDMAKNLGKDMELELEGQGVELDKTIIESLGDPLTHLVRNSADHGIESPAARKEKGKNQTGRILLRALHESGQVIIEIHDDGKGLDPEKIAEKAVSKGLISEDEVKTMSAKEKVNLIMLPGLSTAEQVTDVSGRGVGMDVVKTNLDKLGGQVEIISQLDKGTVIRIKLPLTLAIIACLLVSSANERYAIPQVNVGELIQVPAAEVREKIEKVGDAEVLILRGELIPLMQLGNVLQLQNTFYNPRTGTYEVDRRHQLVDERILTDTEKTSDKRENTDEELTTAERRESYASDVKIVVVQAGIHKYGLVVDKLHDTVEIVVKPLGRHLNKFEIYAGATIMGDGHVALILDISGLARAANLRTMAETDRAKQIAAAETQAKEGTSRQTLLMFHNGPDEYCAVPLHMVLRVEQIKSSDIEFKGGKKVIQYRGGSLPIYALEEVANVEALEDREDLIVIVFIVAGHEVGLLAVPPLDVVEADLKIDEETLRQPGISGSTIIRDETTLMIDVFDFMKELNPQWFESGTEENGLSAETSKTAGNCSDVLLVEDSQFFRDQVRNFIETEGYAVFEAEDGIEALQVLDEHIARIGLVVTDLEMPNMDGFELTSRIRKNERFTHLPVLALTSLAGEEDVTRGREAGIDDYQIKLDKENLIKGIHKMLHQG